MGQNCLEMSAQAQGPPRTIKALRAENARLRTLCAEAEELAARNQLALREGDHRIKNSLQVVASLMGMHERRETSESARAALRAATARIKAIARMHDALQLNGSTDRVNLGELVETMCLSLHAMAGDPERVKVIVNAEPIEAPVALAQPLVLAINELVVNALRHAFVEDRAGTVDVSLQRTGGALRILVVDDGVGLPAGHQRSPGFGTKLVRMMVAKVGGVLRVESTNGARFEISVPHAAGV